MSGPVGSAACIAGHACPLTRFTCTVCVLCKRSLMLCLPYLLIHAPEACVWLWNLLTAAGHCMSCCSSLSQFYRQGRVGAEHPVRHAAHEIHVLLPNPVLSNPIADKGAWLQNCLCDTPLIKSMQHLALLTDSAKQSALLRA